MTLVMETTTTTTARMTAAPVFDLEASPIHGQTASCVLDLRGNLVVPGQMEEHQAQLLYQMLVETSNLKLSGLRRMTVSFTNVRYAVARDENHVYIARMTV